MYVAGDIKDLKNKVEDAILDVFNGELDNYVKKKVNSRIKTDVYGSYRPQVYKRKYLLYLSKHHKKQIFYGGNSDVYYKYEHRAMLGNSNLSKLIILGQEGARRYTDEPVALYRDKYIRKYKESGATDTTPFYEPRNFIESAVKDIQASDILKMLKKELG